jgi:hypothetical protein
MNKVYDNNGNEMKIGKGMEEWNYIKRMIEDQDFNCTVHIELDITKVEEDGDVYLVAKDKDGIIDRHFIFDHEIMKPGEHYDFDIVDVLSLIIGDYHNYLPFPESLRKKLHEMKSTLHNDDIKAIESMR